MQEIHQKLKLNIPANPDLLEKICRNERIIYDNNTLCYKPLYNIRCKEDIITVLQEIPDHKGIDLAVLKEAFPKVEEAAMV